MHDKNKLNKHIMSSHKHQYLKQKHESYYLKNICTIYVHI